MGGLCSREVTTAAVRPTPVEVLRQENTLLEDNLSPSKEKPPAHKPEIETRGQDEQVPGGGVAAFEGTTNGAGDEDSARQIASSDAAANPGFGAGSATPSRQVVCASQERSADEARDQRTEDETESATRARREQAEALPEFSLPGSVMEETPRGGIASPAEPSSPSPNESLAGHASTNGGAAGFSDDPPAEDAASTEQDSGAAQGKIEIQCVEKTAAGAEAVPSRGAEAAGDAPLRFQCSIVSVASVMAYDSEIGEGINDLHIVPDEESSDSEEEESSKASLSQPILVEEDEDVLTNAVLSQLYCDLSDNRSKD